MTSLMAHAWAFSLEVVKAGWEFLFLRDGSWFVQFRPIFVEDKGFVALFDLGICLSEVRCDPVVDVPIFDLCGCDH